jgi:hemerythrin
VEAFTWDPGFDTHLDEVDHQHHRLVELINALGNVLVERGEDPSAQALQTLEQELADYAAHHFEDEERLMVERGVDERHRANHHREHEDFRASIAQLARPDGHPPAARGRRVLEYLTRWLAYHILGADQAMARQMAAIAAGSTPAAALEAEVVGHDPASALLLRSVGELFRVLSARNRELDELNRTLEARVAERTRELAGANEELRALVARVERLAMTDALTGLPNRRYAMARLAAAWAGAVRHGRPLGCLLVDADHFKEVNDCCGHEAGDTVLVALAETLRRAVREADEVCRLGGDEFLVLCPETDLAGMLVLGERLRRAVAAIEVRVTGGAWKGSISVGAAAWRRELPDADQLLREADAGVYEAKRRGRNAVATAPSAAAAAVPA